MILEVQGLTRHFGGIKALDGVDFRLGRGELAGIIGPNGSGKTTLFNVITGIYRPDRGAVSLEEGEITGLPPHEITRRGIARTFQNIRLFRDLTVVDNVRIAHHPHVRYGAAEALLRTGAFYREERRTREQVGGISLDLFPPGSAERSSRRTCRTAIRGNWRSPARLRRARRSSCWTSPRRG